jgi:hypothetical protein
MGDARCEGERWLIGAPEDWICRFLARFPVPQMGARAYDLAEAAIAGVTREELAADFGLSVAEAAIMVLHWHAFPDPGVIAARTRSSGKRWWD